MSDAEEVAVVDESTSTVIVGAVDFIHAATGLATSAIGRYTERLVSDEAVESLLTKVIKLAVNYRPGSDKTAAADRFTILIGRSFRIQNGEATELSPGAIIRGCNLEEVKTFQRDRLKAMQDRINN